MKSTALPGWLTLKRTNIVLATIIVLINVYVLVLPILPKLTYSIKKHRSSAVAGLPYQTQLTDQSASNNKRKAIPDDNRLVIPSIALDEAIFQGTSPYTVNKGVWARPHASTPDAGHNTVLVAHRFTYSGPATFYNLDKVAVGDTIVTYWNKQEYDYVVTETKVVAATDLAVENPTSDPTLTLYTCTPLWSAKDRLVIIAKPQKVILP